MKFKKIFLITLFLFTISLAGCNIKEEKTGDFGLLSVTSEAKLKSMLKPTTNFWDGWFIGGARSENNDAIAAPEAGTLDPNTSYTGSNSIDYTKTNVQVEGVDEGDIVKTDGNRIYSIKHDTLQVVDILENGQMDLVLYEKIINQVDQTNSQMYNYTYFTDIYVTDKYLVVLGQQYKHYYIIEGNLYDPFNYRYTNMSIIYIYDINTLTKIDSYEISGSFLDSRLIENNLYLISNYYVYYNYIQENDDFDPRPWVVRNGEMKYFDYEEIKYLPESEYQSFTTITNVKLNDEITYDNDVFLGAQRWGTIYVSTNAIYFAHRYYTRDFLGASTSVGKLLSFQFETNGNVIFGGEGEFEGYVFDQFSMDEYNGYMRIVTTEGWGTNTKNRLYVFERKLTDNKYILEVVGKIDEGLGKPGERVRSVRFNKDKATIVTFEQTDPFYTIDLSDPTKPTIKGALEVTGFSTYQHPWTDTTVIGIGFEADSNGRTTGMKISLYDISDFENPVEIGTPLLLSSNSNNTWSYSEALYNHKAIMIDKSHNAFGFSMWINDWNTVYKRMNEYLVFDVDSTRPQPIQIKYSVNHNDYYTDNPELYYDYYYYNFEIQRGVRIGDYLFVISGEAVTSHNLIGEFGLVDDIVFERDK